MQAVPEGTWTVTTKLDHTAITVNGQAAGLVLYGRQNPNHFAKATLQFKNDVDPNTPGNQPGKWIERTLTTNGTLNSSYGGNFPNSGALTPPTNDLWIRARYDGTNVITEYSYDGDDVHHAGAAGSGRPRTARTASPRSACSSSTTAAARRRTSSSTPSGSTRRAARSRPTRRRRGPRTSSIRPSRTATDGWYTSPVEVTLNATDNDGGSGVDTTEYRFAGDEEWTPYTAPFTVDDEGRHTIEYRSTDNEGNTESTKSVSLQDRRDRPDDDGAAERRGAGGELRRPGRGRPRRRRRRRVGRPRDADPGRRRRSGSRTWRRRRSSTPRPTSSSGSRPAPAGSPG